MNSTLLLTSQIVISLLVVLAILSQRPAKRESITTQLIQPKFTRRGWEKISFFLTLFLIALFVAITTINLVFSQ